MAKKLDEKVKEKSVTVTYTPEGMKLDVTGEVTNDEMRAAGQLFLDQTSFETVVVTKLAEMDKRVSDLEIEYREDV